MHTFRQRLRRRIFSGTGDYQVLKISLVFLCCALLTSLVKADVKTVEGLSFNRVVLHGDNELEITQGDSNSLKLRGKTQDLAPLPFTVNGNTLELGINASDNEADHIKYRLTAVDLRSLTVNGSGEAYVKPLQVDNLAVTVEGSGDMRLFEVTTGQLDISVKGSGAIHLVRITAEQVRLHLSGSGDIQVGSLNAGVVSANLEGSGDISVEDNGSADTLEVKLMGSGDISLGKLQVMTADASIMGSGDLELWVEEELSATILGSGDVDYKGSPTTNTSVFGSGSIEQHD